MKYFEYFIVCVTNMNVFHLNLLEVTNMKIFDSWLMYRCTTWYRIMSMSLSIGKNGLSHFKTIIRENRMLIIGMFT